MVILSWAAIGRFLGISAAALWILAYLADDAMSYLISGLFSVLTILALVTRDDNHGSR